MGLLLIGIQSLCQVSNTRCQDTHLFDIYTYFKMTSILVQLLLVF